MRQHGRACDVANSINSGNTGAAEAICGDCAMLGLNAKLFEPEVLDSWLYEPRLYVPLWVLILVFALYFACDVWRTECRERRRLAELEDTERRRRQRRTPLSRTVMPRAAKPQPDN